MVHPLFLVLASSARAAVTRRRFVIAASLVLVLGVGLLFVPQFNLLNYYFSFAMSLVVPLLAAVVAARIPSDTDGLGERFGQAVISGVALLLVPLLLVALGAFWVTNCDILGGLRHYALGPCVGVLFGIGLGLFAGTSLTRGAATVTVFAVFFALLVVNFVHLYRHPPISAYNHFAGFWAGAIYDDNVAVTHSWALFRAYTASLGVALLAGVVALEWVSGWFGVLAGALAPLAIVFLFETGSKFDLRRQDIQEALGATLETEHFIIHYPDGGAVSRRIDALAKDHEFRWAQLRDALDLAPTYKIRSFIYETEAQKQALIGAGSTFIAKPWTHEMHLNAIEVGASVLRHELAHVFGADIAGGALGVPTAFGFFPKMGIVEGFAVALESARGRLTVHQWSAAMRAQNIAPPMQDILKAEGFLGTHAGKAYTLAGSFLRYLRDVHGLDAFRELYRTGELEDAYDPDADELIAEWEAFLDDRVRVPLTEDDQMLARFQFDQPSRFHRVCALEVGRWEQEAEEASEAGKKDDAVTLYRKILSYQPQDPEKRYELLDALIAAGKLAEAQTLGLALVEDGSAGLVIRARAEVRLADLAWLAGRTDEAKGRYLTLAGKPLDEGTRRRVLVASQLFTRPDVLRKPLLDYLIGGQPSGNAAALDLLRPLAASHPNDPLIVYLLGRRAETAGMNAEADQALARSLASGLAPGALAFEAERLRAMMAFEDGRYRDAGDRFVAARDLTDGLGQAAEMADWAERCVFWAKGTETTKAAKTTKD